MKITFNQQQIPDSGLVRWRFHFFVYSYLKPLKKPRNIFLLLLFNFFFEGAGVNVLVIRLKRGVNFTSVAIISDTKTMAKLVNYSGKSFIKLTPAADSHMPPMFWDKAANTASSGK